MRSLLALAAVVAAMISSPLQAQRDFSTRSSYSMVRCESFGQRQNFCAADTRGGVRLANDASGRCRIGQTWGYTGSGIWVSGGCRADFAMGRGENYGWGWGYADKRYVVCASENYQRSFCPATVGRGVRLVNQISNSACVRGRTWWRDARGIVVDNGCAGEFEIGYRDADYVTPPSTGAGGVYRPEQLLCSSRGAARRYCPADVGTGAVALVKSVGGAPCVYGRNWGYDARGVWVSKGCAAEFEIGYPSTAWIPAEGVRHVRCESVDYERATCAAPRARTAVLQRQLSRSACVEGRTWGYERGQIWVDDGCAADFVLN